MAKYDKWITEDGCLKIRGWARDGLSNGDIAHNMGVSRITLIGWCKKYPDIAEAMENGREIADRRVENALYEKAIGIKTTVRRAIKVKKIEIDSKTGRKTSEKEEIEYVDEEIFIPPDVVAQKFWLTNRKPDVWRNKTENDNVIDADENGTVMIESIQEIEDECDMETTAQTGPVPEQT